MNHLLLTTLVLLFPISEVALGLSQRARGRATASAHDRGSLRLIWIVIAISVTLAGFVAGYRSTQIHTAPRTIGLIAFVLLAGGLLLRWTSILVLGRFFTVNVAIVPGHRVVDTGPYRFVRHPSYTGLLLAFLGLGFYFANWLSLVVLMIPITAALLYRIRVEETALHAALGTEYSDYCARTRRLVPFIL